MRNTARKTIPPNGVWATVKQQIAFTATTTVNDRIHQAHAFFEHRVNAQNLATAAPWTSPWLPPGYGKDFWQGA